MTHDLVQDYYGQTLSSSQDLRTDACCDASAVPDAIKPLLAQVHPEVLARYYGCGQVLPEALGGRTVLDLGCGTGRDVYVLAQIVGAGGAVHGVDMTRAQLAVARETLAWHLERWGSAAPEIAFHDGRIEALGALPLAQGSVDVIVSNCVINLSPDKPAVFAGAARLLGDGGELHFADVYADRPVPARLRDDPVLLGECLAGALDWDGFLAAADAAGFATPRLVSARPLTVTDPEVAAKLGGIRFFSATTRLFKRPQRPLADAPCLYAHYRSDCDGPETLVFDIDTVFTKGAGRVVDAETAAVLAASRMAPWFRIDTAVGGAAVVPRRGLLQAVGAGAACCR